MDTGVRQMEVHVMTACACAVVSDSCALLAKKRMNAKGTPPLILCVIFAFLYLGVRVVILWLPCSSVRKKGCLELSVCRVIGKLQIKILHRVWNCLIWKFTTSESTICMMEFWYSIFSSQAYSNSFPATVFALKIRLSNSEPTQNCWNSKLNRIGNDQYSILNLPKQ